MPKAIIHMVIFMVVVMPSIVWADSSNKNPMRLVVVAALDETGSYSMRSRGLAMAKSVIQVLQPRDVFYFRRITGSSFKEQNTIFRLEIPSIPPKPTNRFDQRAWIRHHKGLRRVQTIKAQAIKILSQLKPIKAKRTDIYGFLAAASLRYQAEDEAGPTRRMMIIASDMQNNVTRQIKPDLKGVEVQVIVWEPGDDPTKAYKLKKAWRKVLVDQCGARSVKFLTADMRLVIKR